MSSIYDMSQPSLSSTFQPLFNAALQAYAKQTGTKLVDHSFAKQFEKCNSVESITSVLQEHARAFREFRGEDGRIMKSLKCIIHILYMLSTSTVLGEGIGIPFPPAKAVFAAFVILLAAVKSVSASYDALVELFESIGRFLSRLDTYTKIPLTAAMTDIIVKILVEVLSSLALATKQVKQGRLKTFIRKFLGENEIEAGLQRLDRLTSDEARAAVAQTLEVVHDLQAGIEIRHQIASNINKPRQAGDELQKSIREWLSPPDLWINHNIAVKSQHDGTGAWWIEGDTFLDWKHTGSNPLLWISGKPGAGKSVLSSSIIDHIRGMRTAGLASLAFFYCDFRDDKKKHLRGLLSSLLVQLCDQSDTYYGVLSDFYSEHGSGEEQASDRELSRCLNAMLGFPEQPTIYIIIDGLDECPKTTTIPSPRDEVLDLVEQLVNLHPSNLRICVTSRPEIDIASVLDRLAFRSISIHKERGQIQDIIEYIKAVINTDREMQRWKTEDKELVIDVLTKKADGMFRWAFCQLVYLRDCLPGRIRHALAELPETLDETYERMIQDISSKNWEYAHRLFQCVAAASRPLRVEELAEFLAFDFNTESTPTLLEDWRPEDSTHAVLSTCSSLLAIDDDSPTVIQFSHFSVKEYLTSKRLAEAKDTISRFRISMTPAHTILAQACLGVLLHIDENVTRADLEVFPLAEYAAKHWVDHALFEGVSPSIQDEMKRLFDPNNRHFSVWVSIHDPQSTRRTLAPVRSVRPSKPRATPLHYAAFYGLHDIAKFLIVERSQDVNARSFRKDETPLSIASRRGHFEVARALLEHGADTNTRDKRGWSILDQASWKGHVAVIQVLLEHGIDVNAVDKENTTALHVASTHGEAEAARVLLKYGADPNAKGRESRTPLHCAPNEGVAHVLMEYNADVNARDSAHRTPLHRAVVRGRVDVVRVLLEKGADANPRDSKNRTPLHMACEKGNLDIVRLLLRNLNQADIQARDNKGQIPSHVASASGHRDVMQLLEDHKARST